MGDTVWVLDVSATFRAKAEVPADRHDLQQAGLEVEVVTEDRAIGPPKVSLSNACEEMGVAAIDLDTFLRSIDGW